MRYVKGDTSYFFNAFWFFCKPTARAFPGVHRFGSANWDYKRGLPSPLGDDATNRQLYYNGRNLNRSDGTKFAGPQVYFEEGAPGPGTIPRGQDGTPIECLEPPFGKVGGGLCVDVNPGVGGKIGSGKLVTSQIPLVCGDIPLTSVFADQTAGTGIFAPFVGQTITMTWHPFGLFPWTGCNGGVLPYLCGEMFCLAGSFGGNLYYEPGHVLISIPSSPTTSLFPIDFMYSLNYFGDTATFHFHQ